jgi:hypothetical protein
MMRASLFFVSGLSDLLYRVASGDPANGHHPKLGHNSLRVHRPGKTNGYRYHPRA